MKLPIFYRVCDYLSIRRITSLSVLLLMFSFLIQAQDAEATFIEFKLKDLGTIQIPVTMELQGGDYKEMSDAFSKDFLKEKGYEVSGDQIIFQQKGLNEFKGFNTYARVMIATTRGKSGDYGKLGEKLKASQSELRLMDSTLKKEVVQSFEGTGAKLIRWDGVSIVLVKGKSAIKTAYLRQLNDNPPVYVEMYQFQNYDRSYSLTISYRQKDEVMWKDSLERTKNSFTITNIR